VALVWSDRVLERPKATSQQQRNGGPDDRRQKTLSLALPSSLPSALAVKMRRQRSTEGGKAKRDRRPRPNSIRGNKVEAGKVLTRSIVLSTGNDKPKSTRKEAR
jgi:hypothetical protein